MAHDFYAAITFENKWPLNIETDRNHCHLWIKTNRSNNRIVLYFALSLVCKIFQNILSFGNRYTSQKAKCNFKRFAAPEVCIFVRRPFSTTRIIHSPKMDYTSPSLHTFTQTTTHTYHDIFNNHVTLVRCRSPPPRACILPARNKCRFYDRPSRITRHICLACVCLCVYVGALPHGFGNTLNAFRVRWVTIGGSARSKLFTLKSLKRKRLLHLSSWFIHEWRSLLGFACKRGNYKILSKHFRQLHHFQQYARCVLS